MARAIWPLDSIFLPAAMHSGSKVFCKSCLKRQEVCRSLTHLVKLMCARFQSKVSYLKNEDKDEGDKSHVHVATFFNIACKFCHFLDMHNRLLEYELIARLINVQPAYPESQFAIFSYSTPHHTIVKIQTRVTGANHKPRTPSEVAVFNFSH